MVATIVLVSIFLGRKCYTRFFFSDISIFPNLYAMHSSVSEVADSTEARSQSVKPGYVCA